MRQLSKPAGTLKAQVWDQCSSLDPSGSKPGAGRWAVLSFKKLIL